jgi:Reverse transcriptase (RNA-dependent DNA polymerase)
MIIGCNMLWAMGLIVDFKDNLMTWDDVISAMKTYPKKPPLPNEPSRVSQMILNLVKDDLITTDECLSSDILQSKYELSNIRQIAQGQKQLTPSQHDELEEILLKFPKLFSGGLGKFNGKKIHPDLDPTVPSVASCAYTVPERHKCIFKQELDHLNQEGVLEPCTWSAWIAGAFIIPKKDGCVRWVSNFCGLKAIKRKVYPIPIISDVLRHRRRYKYLTKIDLSMQYYCFQFDNASKELCTIAMPFGLYRYWRLPMGVNQSPDIAQEIMERVLSSIMEEIECYINNIAASSNDWESHKTLLNKLLTKLQNAFFTVNPLKCKWAVQETDFLGHWLTPTGIKPWEKKVRGILDMQAPTNMKQIRAFLGMVGYYRDMWPLRSHILAPLTELTGKKAFVWEDKHQQAFEQMKSSHCYGCAACVLSKS